MKRSQYPGVLLSGGLGGLLKDYLDGEGLEASAVRSRIATWEAGGRVPITEWVHCLALICGEHPRPAMGLAIGRYAQLRHAGMLGYLCLSSDNLGEVFDRIGRFHALAWGGIAVPVTRTKDALTIRWLVPEGMPTQSRMVQLSHETGLACLVTLMRLLCEAPVNPIALEMGGVSPEQTGLYEQFFHCTVTFGAPAASLTFPVHALDLPIRTRSSGLREYSERRAQARLGDLTRGDAILAALHAVLVRALHEGEPTITHAAKGMGMSRATLQRRLEERGLNFRAFLDQTRLELARMYLADSRLTLTEITWLLAFSEQSAFNRSFKRWTGTSPDVYRRRLCGTP